MEIPKHLIEEEEGIDIRKWFFRIIDNWALFLIFVLCAIIVSLFYNVLSVKAYDLSTSVLIKENSNPLDKTNMVKVSLYSDPYRLENEVGILNSLSIKKATIKQLDFFVEYFQKQRFHSIELYKNSPFIVEFDTIHDQPVNVEFEFNYLSDSTVFISAKSEEALLYNYKLWQPEGTADGFYFSDTITLGDTLKNLFMSFILKKNVEGIYPGYKKSTYSFYFRDLPYLAAKYGATKVEIPKSSSIITLSLTHPNPEKAALYLNTLLQNYLAKGIERENQIAQRTIDFIDLQLSTLVDSLQTSEQKLEDFRSVNRLVNIDYQAQQDYTRQSEIEKQRAELVMQKKYLEYLLHSLKSNSINVNELIAPTTLGINDAVLNNLVAELIELYNERTELTLNTRKSTPYIVSVDSKIESLKNKLPETINNILEATNISLEGIETQINDVSAKLSKLPKNQRELLSFQRKFQLNDELYTYLLTRRSEMLIKKASNLPSNEILDEAIPSEAILSHPNKRLSFIIAFILGLFVPFGIVYIRVILNNKIQSQDDIKAITDIPVIGTVYENENLELPVVVHAPNSVVAESFRILRANMQFIVGDTRSPVIVVSSAMKGEGKSYTAINFAAIYASFNKKVCLIDLDLRRPKLAEYMKIGNKKGMSNYLIGQAKIDEIIYPVNNGLFDVIPSGPIPPNPSELVASNKLEELLKTVKERYDIIVLDSPPIGMVSDAMFIIKNAGYLLLVIRHNVTHKHLLSILLDEMKRNQVPGLNIIYNDVPAGKKGYYRYGSRYGYYYTKEHKGWFSKIIDSFS
jgi:tyrosine-protein kinase Etk/Wzc